MPGATLRIDVKGLRETEAALDRLQAAGADLGPAMRDIGEHLLNTTRQRFSDQKDPDGTP